MTRVITYGTFDLFHEGHRRLLERAKALGDYLVVGVTSDRYDASRGKLNVHQGLAQRIDNVAKSGLADRIIVEEHDGQKINDIQELAVDLFAIGSDWLGRFDYLRDYCEVVYLERTAGVSSTQLRAGERGVVRLGVSGAGRIADRFIVESKFVSGINVEGVYSPRAISAHGFAGRHQLEFSTTNFDELVDRVDAIYIASPHGFHVEQVRRALEKGRHVLCEKPMSLDEQSTAALYELAQSKGCVLLEAIKTAYAPGFVHLVALARSGAIGAVRAVDATFTKLVEGAPREMQPDADGGSISELASYPLVAVTKILGTEPIGVHVDAFHDPAAQVDVFARIALRYPDAVATATVGLAVKSEGHLVVAGTTGYIYVPAPWWKTDYFEVRREDPRETKRFSDRFDGDGLRYEIAEFLNLIGSGRTTTHLLSPAESTFIAGVIGKARASGGRADVGAGSLRT